mmetsp:Transcript_40546/g.128807  ORF Transcript_40546/g.128807 Transcript_40546/m.128807 type:complete len:277 (+) Transcript_40546:463-1293(+)
MLLLQLRPALAEQHLAPLRVGVGQLAVVGRHLAPLLLRHGGCHTPLREGRVVHAAGGHHHDPRLAARSARDAQGGPQKLRQQVGAAEEVAGEGHLHALVRQRALVHEGPGVADQAVDAAGLLRCDDLRHAPHVALEADVRGNDDQAVVRAHPVSDLLARGICPGLAAADHVDLGALLGEERCHLPADAGIRPRDDVDVAREVHGLQGIRRRVGGAVLLPAGLREVRAAVEVELRRGEALAHGALQPLAHEARAAPGRKEPRQRHGSGSKDRAALLG